MSARSTRVGQAMILAVIALPLVLHAAPDAALRLDAQALAGPPLVLADGWRYHSGDDAEFSRVDFNDSSWEVVGPAMRPGEIPKDWSGIGWFRSHIELARDLENVPIALALEVHGATDLCLDGELRRQPGRATISVAAGRRPRLEEARELRLSMLPRELPEVAGLDIAAHMETATEVGGDYYDFVVEENGALTFAVGDATGHGLRAGTMVTAAKSLFQALAPGSDLVETLKRAGAVLMGMKLRRLAMALALGRYRDGSLQLAAAGMPPIFIYRAKTAAVEAVSLPGMPLGSLVGFPYDGATVELGLGDVVLLLSDGFPERLNARDEVLGYERATAAFVDSASGSAAGVIAALRKEGEAWAAGRVPDDDITFVVLKRSA